MDRLMHDRLIDAIAAEPDDFSGIELNFMAGIIQSYAESGRRMINKKKLGIAEPEVRMKIKVAEALLGKLTTLAAKCFQEGDHFDG